MNDIPSHLDGSGRIRKGRAGQGVGGGVGGGTPVYIVSMLICSPEAWICMAGWWSACVCVCLIQGFSSERMGKHWVFYSH